MSPDGLVLPATHPKLKRENATLQIQADVELNTKLTSQPAESVEVRSENILFTEDQLPERTVLPGTIDETRTMDADATAALGNYLSRPVKIHSFTWNESDSFTTSPILIHPWHLYFNNTYIKRKLENFARLNCKLKLTFRFNASPFYYGLLRAAYDPMNTNRLAPVGTDDMIPISQAPGVWIEPNKATSVELELPFLWPHNWLNVGNAAEFTHMGKIMFTIFSPLRSANGVSGSGITVSTYAEAVDVTVAGLTLGAALQAGVVSAPATAIANIAGALKNQPTIGKFARAVEVGSRAVSTIASMFGFSNPPNVKDVNAVQNKSFHAFANTETSMPADKLSVDPHNEVTIDNSVAGVDGKDELGINYLSSKTSYLTQVDWQGSDAAGTKLMTYAVSPGICKTTLSGVTTSYFLPPVAWVGNMFRQWHGSMEVHIKIVKSQYHKGRLMVCWDPNGIPTATAETALFTEIIDLGDDRDEYTFVIPYKCTFPWCRVALKDNGVGIRSDCTPDPATCNGVIGIFVQNVLTAPAASPVVDVLLSVNAGPDMQFSIPRTMDLNATTLQLQADVSPIDDEDHKANEKLNLITVGETIVSLRPLLHRVSFSYSQLVGTNRTGPTSYVGRGLITSYNVFPRLPPVYGTDSASGLSWAAKTLTTGNVPCNFSANHPINWVLMGFVGYRGSTNVHANVICGGKIGLNMCSFSATRSHEDYIVSPSGQFRNAYTQMSQIDDSSSLSRNACIYVNSNGTRPARAMGHGGMSLTNCNTQSALSVNVPMYTPWKFMPAWPTYRDFVPQDGDRSSGIRYHDNVRIDTGFFLTEALDENQAWPVLDMYYSAGVDFQPVYFVGVPRFYAYPPPNAIDSMSP